MEQTMVILMRIIADIILGEVLLLLFNLVPI